MNTSVFLLLYSEHLSAWSAPAQGQAKPLLIQGEASVVINNSAKLAQALVDIKGRLQGDGYDIAHLHFVQDASSAQTHQHELASTLAKHSPSWQILAWDWLSAHLGLPAQGKPKPAQTAFAKVALPWLQSTDDAQARGQLKTQRETEHSNESERLAAERNAYAQENQRLLAQNTALRQVDKERLLSFLPALFPKVFTVLGAADLGLLCGSVTPLNIPNPYPEPSEETLRTLQKQFRALPRQHQIEIVALVHDLPQRQKLRVRPEMRELVQEMEEGL